MPDIRPDKKKRPAETFYFDDPTTGESWSIPVDPSWTKMERFKAAELALREGYATRARSTSSIEDSSPINIAPLYPPSEDYRSLQPDTVSPPLNHEAINYGKKGIVTGKSGKDFSFEEYSKIGTATNPDEKALAIGSLLQNKYELTTTKNGKPLRPNDLVRIVDGDILYLDMKSPKNPSGSNRWVKFEDSIKSGWGVAKGAGGMAGYGVGFLPGLMSGNPVAAHLGGAAGAGLVTGGIEGWRVQSGINQGVSDPAFSNPWMEGGKEAIMTGATTLAGDAIVARGNRPGRVNSYYFDPGYEKEMRKGLEEYEKVKGVVDRINREGHTGADALDIPAAKASGVAELLNLEATITAKQSTKQAEGLSEKLLKKVNNANRTITSALDHLLGGGTMDDTATIGAKIKGAVPKLADDPEYKAASAAGVGPKQEMDEFYGAFAPKEGFEEQVVNRLRGSTDDMTGLMGQKTADEAAENEAWAEVGKSLNTRFVPRKPPPQPSAPPPAARMSTVLGPDGRPMALPPKPVPPPKQQLPGEGWADLEEVSDHILVIKPDNPRLRPLQEQWAQARNVLFPESAAEAHFGSHMDVIIDSVNSGKQIDLTTLMGGIKQLRQIERQNITRASGSPYKVDERFLKNLELALVGIRNDYMEKNTPEAFAKLTKAEELTRDVTDRYYRTILKDILALKDPLNPDAPKLLPTQVLNSIFTKESGAAADMVMTALRGDPGAVDMLRRSVMAKYAREVMQDGIVDPKKHMEWMRTYGPAVRKIVDPRDIGKLDQLGGAARALFDSNKRQELAEQAFKRTFSGKVDKYNAEDIAASLVRGDKKLEVADAYQLTDFLKKNNPEMLEEVKLYVGKSLRDELTRGTGNTDLATFTKIYSLTKGARGSKLRMVMGSQYVDDLNSVAKAIEMMTRRGDPINIPASTPAIAMFRWIWGPLSRTQRFITAAKQYEIAGYEKTLYNILTDPNKLRLAVKYGNVPVNSDVVAPVLSLLGVQWKDDEDEIAFTTKKLPPERQVPQEHGRMRF